MAHCPDCRTDIEALETDSEIAPMALAYLCPHCGAILGLAH